MSNQQQQFATPQDALAHYGVKGMKWGVRRSQSQLDRAKSSGSIPRSGRPKEKLKKADIQAARRRHNARVAKIYEADRDVALATTKKGKDQALKTVEKYAREIATSDDSRIAKRMTRGEQAATIIIPALVLPGVGLAPGAAVVGYNRYKTRRQG